jgi:hypothetical protein
MLKEKNEYQLQIDEEFRRFIPPLSAEERKQLEENILQDGCRDALVVWEKTIIDGHNRYEICTKHRIPFATEDITFSGREEAIAWICANQLGRRNITEETRRYLIGKRYEMEKTIGVFNTAGINQHSRKEVDSQFDNLPQLHETPTKTGERLGKEYRVGSTTVIRYGVYANAIDIIAKEAPELHRRIMSGELKITQEKIVELSRLSPSAIRRIEAEFPTDPNELIMYMDARGLIPKNTPNRVQLAQMQIGAIKDMPRFDPDAEILSLALTIPSWVSSIKRVRVSAKFPEISSDAREKIKTELGGLKASIDLILSVVEEDK